MKVHTLEYSCMLESRVESVFTFHTDTRNLTLITPAWIGVTLVDTELPVKEKSIVSLDIKRFGITTRWEMQIALLDFPIGITDLMIRGLFRFFKHERRFTALSEKKTLMRETISFSLPLGWFGNLFTPLVKKDMDKMFAFRHRATQRYFSEKGST